MESSRRRRARRSSTPTPSPTSCRTICKEFDEITSVTSLAGYEILTEGRGSNAGTCLINLKPWADRERTSKEIIEELEEKGRKIANVKLEFFEPPAVPGFGAAGGFSLCLLDKTNSGDYDAFGKVTEEFMTALEKRKELKGLFTFFANNYPQYEIIIDNDVAMQKGVSIADAMDNLSIVVGSTWEQGFVRFDQFYKVYVQAAPEFRRFPKTWTTCSSRTMKGEMVPYSAFMKIKKMQGMNEINRYNLYTTAIIQGAPAAGLQQRPGHRGDQGSRQKTLPHGYDIGWQGLSYDEANKGNTAIYIFSIVVVFVYLVLVGQYESFHPAAGGAHLAAGRPVRFVLDAEGDGAGQRRLLPDRSGHAGRSARQERDSDHRIRRPAPPGRPEPQGGRHRRRETALPANRDDLVRLHRRSDSAGPCHRPRCDRQPHDRHHRGRRHAHGHADRRLRDSRPRITCSPR